ncbi:hypothetical protein Bca52824_023044 [Brassica carinata]|uniref:Uncharacterized protein n=1 Tax=Brassica carinata TaxID=52824 RepID=A0A8X8AV69_BRACI|nr:hypothetical protein Bca52824_023044 [Brassica carinata]
MVKASVEERLKVLGVGKSPEKNDKLSIVGEEQSLSSPSPQQKSVNSLALAKTPDLGKTPELAKTPGLVFARKRNLAKELDKDTGVKRTLAEEFGSGAAKPAKASEHDFIYVSLAKATKPTKATRDDKDAQDAKGEAYGRGWRGKHIVKDEYTADKKKAEQAEASEDDSDVEHVTDEARAEENEVLTESDVDSQELIISAVVVSGYSERLENSVNAIVSSANRENFPVLYPEGWVHDWPIYRVIPDHFKERWFLPLARKSTWDRRLNSTIWRHFNLVARSLFQFQMRELKRRWAHGGDKPSWMLTRVWRDLVDMFEEFGPDHFGFRQ